MNHKPSEQTQRLLRTLREVEDTLDQTLDTHMHCAKSNVEGTLKYVTDLGHHDLVTACNTVVQIQKDREALYKAAQVIKRIIWTHTQEPIRT